MREELLELDALRLREAYREGQGLAAPGGGSA